MRTRGGTEETAATLGPNCNCSSGWSLSPRGTCAHKTEVSEIPSLRSQVFLPNGVQSCTCGWLPAHRAATRCTYELKLGGVVLSRARSSRAVVMTRSQPSSSPGTSCGATGCQARLLALVMPTVEAE